MADTEKRGFFLHNSALLLNAYVPVSHNGFYIAAVIIQVEIIPCKFGYRRKRPMHRNIKPAVLGQIIYIIAYIPQFLFSLCTIL